MPNQIVVTPEAAAAIARAQEKFGRVLFHIAGGCCDAHSPILLPADELRIGARDILFGSWNDVKFWQMATTPGETCACDATYVLDLGPGTSVGFSIEAGNDVRFTLRDKAAMPALC